MTEELNNQDLFNLEDNEAFEGGDDFPDLPPLTFDKEEEIDIEKIPVEEAQIAALQKKAQAQASVKKGKKSPFTFLKKKESAEKESKQKKTKSLPPAQKTTVAPFKTVKMAAPKPQPQRKTPAANFDLAGYGPLFWTISGAIALLIALILLVVVIVVGFNVVKVANAINQDLVGELYTSFVQMDQAHITTTIPIEAEVPAQFDLQLDTITSVTLSEDVFIDNANVSLSTGGLTITNAPTDIILPAGSELPIHLVLTVPVDEMIPVVMDVEVDIPMSQTELHEPFQNLQRTIQPYYMWLWSLTTKGVKTLDYPWEQ